MQLSRYEVVDEQDDFGGEGSDSDGSAMALSRISMSSYA